MCRRADGYTTPSIYPHITMFFLCYQQKIGKIRKNDGSSHRWATPVRKLFHIIDHGANQHKAGIAEFIGAGGEGQKGIIGIRNIAGFNL